ncbi:MAG TPA: polyprenyl synthetase family protein [Acidimicrobiales bacterium]|nr:polyprenyl synthetase family protein [Acidimicrobiales bacterium]
MTSDPVATVEAQLRADGPVVAAALEDAIARSDLGPYLVPLMADYPSRGGKRLRPLLCLATCRAFGGTTDDAIGAAVALELLHNCFLIRDDIQDSSVIRRGQPSLHVRYGPARALNASDALLVLAFQQVTEVAERLSAPLASRLTAEFVHLMWRTVEGQAAELAWIDEARDDVSALEYLEMVTSKTSWYTTVHPCRVGALLGSGTDAYLDRLVPFTVRLGALFQIRDDLSNLTGQTRSATYPAFDIIEGKRTLVLAHLLEHASPGDRDRVLQCLGPRASGPPEERIDVVLALMHRYGSIEYARQFAEALAADALDEFTEAFAPARGTTDLQFLVALVPYLLGGETDHDS